MNREILSISGILILMLSACTYPIEPEESVPYTYLSFEKYVSLAEKCDPEEIMGSFRAIDNPDFPRIPFMAVRLCQPDLMVLEFQSMWATQEFKIIDTKNRRFSTLEIQSGGDKCTRGDGCEVVTDTECDATPGCKHFRLVQLSEGSRQTMQASIDSNDTLMITDEDFIQIALESMSTVYFHLGEKAYRAHDGKIEEVHHSDL